MSAINRSIGGAARLSLDQAIFLILILAAGAGYCLPPINPDEGAIFDFATRMLSGKSLYTDLVDVNPPLIFLLNLLPAWLARQLALPVPFIITGCILALPVLSLGSLWRFAGLPSESRLVTRLIALALVYVLILYPGAEFSQREHLLLLATIPYLVNVHDFMAGIASSRRTRVLQSLPFAVMVCLKPHFALLPLALEAAAFIATIRRRGRAPAASHASARGEPAGGGRAERQKEKRWRECLGISSLICASRRYAAAGAMIRLEAAILLATGLACIGGTLLVFPAYLGRILPLAGHYYGIADGRLLASAFFGEEARQLLLALGLLLLLHLFWLRRLWLGLMLLAIFALYLAAALQLKDWFYHFLPAHALALLASFCCATTLIVERFQEIRDSLVRRAAVFVVMPLFLAVSLPEMSDSGGETAPPLPYPAQRGFADDGWAAVRTIVDRYAEDKSVMWLSQYNEGTARVAAYAHATLVAPTMSLWMLPALYERHTVRDGKVVFHEPRAMSSDEKWLWNAVALAFYRAAPPVLVYVKDDPGFVTGRFDYIDYFSMNPRFRSRLASYRIAYEDPVVRVYVREPNRTLLARVAGEAEIR